MSKRNLYIYIVVHHSYPILTIINYNSLPELIPIYGTINSVSAYGDKAIIFAPMLMVPKELKAYEISDSNKNIQKIIENK